VIDVTSFAAGAVSAAVPSGLLLYGMGRALRAARYAATHDGLTGLLNRHAFKTQARRLLAASNGAAAVAIVDLDWLKRVNDAPGLGHDAGDAVLVAAAVRMSKVVGEHGLVARLGGDEFAVAVAAPADVAVWRADLLFAELAARIGDPVTVQPGKQVRVSASVGVAPVDGVSELSGLLKRADVAMYRAKGQPDRRVVVDVGEPAEPAAPVRATNGHRLDLRNPTGRLWPVWGGGHR
jgi:diguanylate cyclase (GGDEF)-like protein